MYRVRATIRRLNHRPKTPADSTQGRDPYLRDTVILGCSRARARLSPFSASFIPPSRRVSSEARIKEDKQKRRNETRTIRRCRVFPRICIVLLCARVCILLRAWGWFTANWFVNVALVSFKTERETRISVFLACMIRYTALVCSLRVRVSKKIRETFTSHTFNYSGGNVSLLSLSLFLISFSLVNGGVYNNM